MRRKGLAETPHDLGLNGHACWSYDDPSGDFLEAAVTFFAEGLALRQRLMFVGGEATQTVVCGYEPLATLVREGRVLIAPFGAFQPDGRRMPHHRAWAVCARAMDRALAEGYAGLRVLAEVSELAAGEAWCDHATWESYADRLMVHRPLAALCCFDRKSVPERALAAVASAHPLVDQRLRELVPFQLFGLPDGLALTGEIDVFASATLDRLLSAGPRGTDLTLDVEGVTFIDHTGMRSVQRHARRLRKDGGRLRVRGDSPAFWMVAELCRAEF